MMSDGTGDALYVCMKMESFKVIISTPRDLTDQELEQLAEKFDEIDFKDKVYGIIRELLRERFSSEYQLDVNVD